MSLGIQHGDEVRGAIVVAKLQEPVGAVKLAAVESNPQPIQGSKVDLVEPDSNDWAVALVSFKDASALGSCSLCPP